MTARCAGCSYHRAHVGIAGCKPTPLCRLIDVTLLARHKGKSLDELREIHRKNGVGAQLAGTYVDSITEFPQTSAAFANVLRDIHLRIFSEGEPAIAGCFRLPGEPVYFGSEGNFLRCGSPSERIAADLDELFARVVVGLPTNSDKRVLCTRIARFLERFFIIHPFPDGNGRVGREFADLAARFAGWRWNFKTVNSKWRRRYLQAVEFAHIYTEANEDPRFQRRRDTLIPLARWIDYHLVKVEDDWDLLEEEPSRSD